MKQRDWIEEWENRETWVVFDQAGSCFGLVTEEYIDDSGSTRYLIRCRCDMQKTTKNANNHIFKKNIISWHNTFKEAEYAYQKRYNK